jgi:REP element-mobilizing transposase RayT
MNVGHRRSIRLKDYDYSAPGAYFVTICVYNRISLFGEVVDGMMNPNEAGQMIANGWDSVLGRFPEVSLDASVVMPNHTHAILTIGSGNLTRSAPPHPAPAHPQRVPLQLSIGPANLSREDHRPEGDDEGLGETVGAPLVGALGPGGAVRLGDVIGAFKSITTVAYVRSVKHAAWPAFPKQLWQRNYWEHVIRDDAALERARTYVVYNPLRCADDPENLTKSRRQQPFRFP